MKYIKKINVRDPVNGNKTIDPSSLTKIELIVGSTIISTETGEITWTSNVIQIKPDDTTLEALSKLSHSVLIVYKDSEDVQVGHGTVKALDYR
jgi:hypothetical protein